MIVDAIMPALIGLLGLLLAGTIARVLLGPTHLDRAVALDTANLNAAGLFLLWGLWTGQLYLVAVAVTIAIIGFVGTLALSKYLAGGEPFGGT